METQQQYKKINKKAACKFIFNETIPNVLRYITRLLLLCWRTLPINSMYLKTMSLLTDIQNLLNKKKKQQQLNNTIFTWHH